MANRSKPRKSGNTAVPDPLVDGASKSTNYIIYCLLSERQLAKEGSSNDESDDQSSEEVPVRMNGNLCIYNCK